jgi:hypothetical protein
MELLYISIKQFEEGKVVYFVKNVVEEKVASKEQRSKLIRLRYNLREVGKNYLTRCIYFSELSKVYV